MAKIRKNLLITGFLVLALVLSFSIALAKEDDVNKSNINKSQINANENRDKTNEAENQADRFKTQKNENENVNEENANVNENNNENQENDNELNGEKHRSAVATFVQGLLKVADREKGGIGDQVRAIAEEQNDVENQEAEAIDQIENRSWLKTFFIGTDYKNIGQLRSTMVKTGNRIDQLKRLLDKTTSDATKTALQTQIQALEQEQQKINDFIKTNEGKFSLFGWLVKLFYR